jgi:hypothetical protein
MHVDVDVRDAMALVLQPAARDGWIVIRAETGGAAAVGVMETARWAEGVQGRAAVDRLGGDHRGARHERGAFVELVGDRVVGGVEAGLGDALACQTAALGRVAQPLDEVDILGRMHELELLVRRRPWRQQVAVLDQARGADELHRQLDPDRLKRVSVGKVVLHQLVAVHQRHRPRHRT